MFTKFTPFKTAKLLKHSKLRTCTPPHTVQKNYADAVAAPNEPQSIFQKAILFQYRNSSVEQFISKKKEKAVHLTKELIHMIVHGTKSAFKDMRYLATIKDMRYLATIKSSKAATDYTLEELREVNRISSDLTKFLPVYASLIIPAGELALFPYLYLFPRALPSYFVNESSSKDAREKSLENQEKAHKELKQYLLSVLSKVAEEAGETLPSNIEEFFLAHKETILPLLEAKMMDSETLKNASDFLMFEYMEGTYILNKIYKTFVNLPKDCVNLFMWATRSQYRAKWSHPLLSYKFKMNSTPFEGLKKQFIKYQFEKQLKTMKAQNVAMLSGLFGELKNGDLSTIARERGYNSENEEEAQNWLKENWNAKIQNHVNEKMFTFWYSVVLYDSHSE